MKFTKTLQTLEPPKTLSKSLDLADIRQASASSGFVHISELNVSFKEYEMYKCVDDETCKGKKGVESKTKPLQVSTCWLPTKRDSYDC